MEKKQLVVILKNPGTACNIGCVYCAEARKKYVSIQNKITFEQTEKLAELTKKYSLNVLFHGGEPTLLDCDYYLTLMDIFEAKNKDVFFGIQTNAVELNDKWFEFFKENEMRLGVSVSLDGPKSVNAFRLSKIGEETFDIVFNNVKKLGEKGIKTGMICTIVSTAIGQAQALFEMLQKFDNLQFVKLNPCMDRNEDKSLPRWAVSPTEYFQFVCDFFDILVRNSAWKNYYVEPIISVLKNIQGTNSSFCNYNIQKCHNFISVYPDGTVTSCDNYNLEKGFLGMLDEINDIEEILYMQRNPVLSESYRKVLSKCNNCEIMQYCQGGCIAVRERYADTKEYCMGMKKMIYHIKGVYDFINENY
ncbi:MAG: radical SAM protein [Acetatifactor sp.]|nr:radical SAM protein [Acetatifactor sp.]